MGLIFLGHLEESSLDYLLAHWQCSVNSTQATLQKKVDNCKTRADFSPHCNLDCMDMRQFVVSLCQSLPSHLLCYFCWPKLNPIIAFIWRFLWYTPSLDSRPWISFSCPGSNVAQSIKKCSALLVNQCNVSIFVEKSTELCLSLVVPENEPL